MTHNAHRPARLVLLGLICAASCFISRGALAEHDVPLWLNPAPGVSARIEKQDDDYVLIQPRGQTLLLLSPGDVMLGESHFFKEADYDFDGYTDLSVGVRVGMVNITHELYLYDPHTMSYVLFQVPDNVAHQQNCSGFWHIERLPERRALQSGCRSAAHWHYDILQIEPDRSVWLSEQSLMPDYNLHWPYFGKPLRSATYDRDGNLLRETALGHEYLNKHADWEVPVGRLTLYSAPDSNAATKAYLIEGDEAAMLAFEGDEWMQIAYEGRQGRIERWVSLKDAYDLARRYDPAVPPPAPLALWAFDYSEVQDDPDFYRNLFTLFVDNQGDEPIPLHQSEIHLVFSGPDGIRVAHRLYDLFDFVLQPEQSRILDDNPIEQHGDRYVLFHQSGSEPEYVEFFPPGLAPGRYEIRPVLTNPYLPGPVYGVTTIHIDYPPRLARELIKP